VTIEPTLLCRPNFKSMQDLYAVRGGEFSAECDLGVWWHGVQPNWPHYRLTWVEDTGDLVVFDPSTNRVYVIAVIPPDTWDDTNNEQRRHMALDKDETRPLYGWAEHCGEHNGLNWVRKQVRPWEVNE
jgi:hypothetical protein